MLLALDTSTHAVTVAVHDGERVRGQSTVVDALRHGELLAPGVTAAMESAGVTATELTRIAVGVGPGPFTGLRVGVVTARTLGAVLKKPVVGVCSLDVLAYQAVVERTVGSEFLVATDARRQEIYWARYDAGGTRLEGPHVSRPDTVRATLPVVGRGAVLYSQSLRDARPPEHPSAVALANLVVSGAARLVPPDPLYLRRPDVARPAERKHVS